MSFLLKGGHKSSILAQFPFRLSIMYVAIKLTWHCVYESVIYVCVNATKKILDELLLRRDSMAILFPSHTGAF